MEETAQQALGLAGTSAEEAANVLIALVTTWGLRVLGAIAVLIIGRMVARRTRTVLQRTMAKRGVDSTLVPFLASLAYYLIVAVVVIAVLNLFGLETTSLVAVLGAAGLAIGLALQGTLSNFSSGVMLLIFRPFRKDDYVEVAGVSGTVVEIGLFTTTLNRFDNVLIVVPNANIYGQTIHNYSGNAIRRNDLVVGISYDDDIGTAIDAIQRILLAEPRVLSDPPPVVAASELGDSSVNLVVRPWCKKEDYWPLRFDLVRALKEGLEAADCSIPFPQHDVHVLTSVPKESQVAAAS